MINMDKISRIPITHEEYLFRLSSKNTLVKYIISLCLIVVATSLLISAIHSSLFFVVYALIMYGLAYYSVAPLIKFSVRVDVKNRILSFNKDVRDISQIKTLAIGKRALLKQKKIVKCIQVINGSGEEIIIPIGLIRQPNLLIAVLMYINGGKIEIKDS